MAAIDVVDLDAATAASALGISTTAVRVARHRALGRLRRIMDSAEQPRPADTPTTRGPAR